MTLSPESRRRVRTGAAVWLFWMVFYAFFFKFAAMPALPWRAAIASSLGSYIPFAFISLGLWRLVQLLPMDRWPIPVFLGMHFLLSMVVSALWLTLTYGGWALSVGLEGLRRVGVAEFVAWQYLFGMVTYLLVVGIFYTLHYFEQFKEKALREGALLASSREAELKALRMQVNPHFLFNTLNSISAMVTQEPQGAREMIAGLSELFRATLEQGERSLHPLKNELDMVRQYLAIEQVRFGDRLTVQETVAPGLEEAAVPVLLLQPLLENAVKHGVSAHRGPARVGLALSGQDGRLRCRVENSLGEGGSPSAGAGTGLANLRRRLVLLYGDRFTLESEAVAPDLFRVDLTLPLEA